MLEGKDQRKGIQKQPQGKTQDSPKEALDEGSLKRVIEALVFASDKPLPIQQIRDIIEDVDTRLIRKLINELKQEYSQSDKSFGITEIAGGFQFTTDPSFGRWLRRLYNVKQSDYLTGPSLETLAIIAYRQPVTKSDIEFIRGVSVDGVIGNLLQKGLVRTAGRKEVVGRPFLYATTNLFLQYFGLNSVQELPALPEFQEADLKLQRKDGEQPVPLSEGRKEGAIAPGSEGDKDGEAKEVTQ